MQVNLLVVDPEVNRVRVIFDRQKQVIEDNIRSKSLTAESLEAARKGLDLDFSEYAAVQNLKSHMFAMGKLTFDEAQFIYEMLQGESVEAFNESDLVNKAALNRVIMWLAKLKGL